MTETKNMPACRDCGDLLAATDALDVCAGCEAVETARGDLEKAEAAVARLHGKQECLSDLMEKAHRDLEAVLVETQTAAETLRGRRERFEALKAAQRKHLENLAACDERNAATAAKEEAEKTVEEASTTKRTYRGMVMVNDGHYETKDGAWTITKHRWCAPVASTSWRVFRGKKPARRTNMGSPWNDQVVELDSFAEARDYVGSLMTRKAT